MERSAMPAVDDADARLFRLMAGVFLGGGLLNAVEALLVPRLKLTLGLDYAHALTVQLAYYASYLLFAIPATMLVARCGAYRSIAMALGTMALGCALFTLAQAGTRFDAMLAALLLVSSGVTVLQIACNGVMATQGGKRATGRFTLLQAFNALGTVMGPLLASWFLLGGASARAALVPFAAFGLAFAGMAAAFVMRGAGLPPVARGGTPTPARLRAVLRERKVVAGVIAIFAYVGAEVTLGTLAVTYLMLPGTMHATPLAAGRLASLYWMGAMIGRFGGAIALRRVAAAALLGWSSAGAILLVGIAILARGLMGSAALLAVGLCNAIMFPAIFSLAMPQRREDVPTASMLLCMPVVGGAIVPMATGIIADRASLPLSFVVPACCYGVILLFARTLPTSTGAAA